MNLFTLLRFLCFSRSAVEEIGSCRQAIWVGVALTLLAAVARDYDGVYLVAEPYHLLIPLAASFVMATIIYIFLRCFPLLRGNRLSYHEFLTYFWLMAPLAYLYAIPVERMFSPVGAAEKNLQLLALVAAWRVLLLARVVSVRESSSFLTTLIKILFIADTIVLVVLFYTPLPIFNIMGGIHLSERDRLISSVALNVGLLGTLLWGVLLLVNIVLFGYLLMKKKDMAAAEMKTNSSESRTSGVVSPTLEERPVHASVWVGMALLLVGGVYLLFWGQPEQSRRYEAERLLKNDKLTEGVAWMSRFQRNEFPPHWTPPPTIGWTNTKLQPHPVDLAMAALRTDSADWVRELTVDKATRYLAGSVEFNTAPWDALDRTGFQEALEILESVQKPDPRTFSFIHSKLKRIAKSDSEQADLAADYLERNQGRVPELAQ